MARDGDGRRVIVDLKWTRSAKARLEELETGRAVQLATYGALLSEDGPCRAGYFLLNQRQFATLVEGGLVGRRVDGVRGFPATWTAIRVSWRTAVRIGRRGRPRRARRDGMEGITSRNDLPIVREVHCERCDYGTLCRVRA